MKILFDLEDKDQRNAISRKSEYLSYDIRINDFDLKKKLCVNNTELRSGIFPSGK